MKVFEIAGPVFSGPSADFAPKVEAPQEELTSAEDVVLSKNGEQAARELKLSDQEIELLKAVALGWADMSDLGDLERDIFEYWFGNNPEDFNPDLHGGGADPSDTIMDELEGWFEDKHPDEIRFDAEFKASSDRIARDAIDDEKTLTPFKYSKGEKVGEGEENNLQRMRKLAGLKEVSTDQDVKFMNTGKTRVGSGWHKKTEPGAVHSQKDMSDPDVVKGRSSKFTPIQKSLDKQGEWTGNYKEVDPNQPFTTAGPRYSVGGGYTTGSKRKYQNWKKTQ